MDTREVPLKVVSSVALPQTVILPAEFGRLGSRRLTLQDRNQKVPAAVRDWLRQDRRYSRWFSEEAMQEAEQEREQQPRRQYAEWRTEWTVPELREYAQKHQIELASDDKRDDVLRKIEAVAGPATQPSASMPPATPPQTS